MSKISIRIVVDAVGALESGTLHGNLFMFDNNRRGGSTGQGSSALLTVLPKDAELSWMVSPLECEAYVSLNSIDMADNCYEVQRHLFPETNIFYWTARMRRAQSVSYGLTLEIGHSGLIMSTGLTAGLTPVDRAKKGDLA